MVVVLGLTVTNAGVTTPNLQGLVVQSGEMPGFTPSGSPQSASNLAQWTKVQGLSRAEVAQLRKAGFVAALQEGLSSTSGSPAGDGGTGVWYFKTPAGAKSFAAHLYSTNSQGMRVRPFQRWGPRGTVLHRHGLEGHSR